MKDSSSTHSAIKLLTFIIFCLLMIWSALYFGVKSANVVILIEDNDRPVHVVNEAFLSLGLDTSNIFYGLDLLKLNSSKLVDLTTRLSPAYLRFGGTMADRLFFAESPPYLGHCARQQCPNTIFPMFTMTESDFLQIVHFCKKTKIRLIFDLNALLRNNDKWNSSNAIKLFKFVKTHNINLDWQLGNEPNSFLHVFNISVSPIQLGEDFKVLRKLLKQYFPNSSLYGPDTTRPQPNRPECVEYMKWFLKTASDYVDAAAWHQYYLNGRTATLDDFWDPSVMNLLQAQINTMIANISPSLLHLKMWLTETSSAYGGGAPHLSNSYASIPLWLDKLGVAAKNDIQVVARQSLLGANYSLIDENHNPLPDYWVSALYKKIVGSKVVGCTIMASQYQRFYCHCATDGQNNLVIFGMNLENMTKHVDIEGLKYYSYIEEYIFTAPDGNRLSKEILLNDNLLIYDDKFPAMIPKTLVRSTDLLLEPYSFVFWKIYNTQLAYCS